MLKENPLRNVVGVWRAERDARCFFLAHFQGGLGDAAGYVALMLLAYERIGSAWAASAVLLADLLPAMLLGPLLGGVIDRRGRLRSAVAADLIRAVAFAGLVLTGGIAPLIGLALLAGLGNAVFRPATSALLPSLVAEERLVPANALYGMVRNGGELLGPALAAALLLAGGPELVVTLNALTFTLSAVLLSRLRGRVAPPPAEEERGGATVRGGIGEVLALPLARALLVTSGGIIVFSGAMNIAELVLAQRDLDAGGTGFALLVSAYGVGIVAGSLLVARSSGEDAMRRAYIAGLGLMGLGLVGSSAAPGIAAAVGTFAVTGAGNSLVVVAVRVMLQQSVPARLHGRAFGLLDSTSAWGLAVAFLGGGALASAAGARITFALAGAGTLLLLTVAARSVGATRRTPRLDLAPATS